MRLTAVLPSKAKEYKEEACAEEEISLGGYA